MPAVLGNQTGNAHHRPRQVVSARARTLVAAAYTKMRANPQDKWARLEMAEALLHTPRPDLVRRHISRLCKQLPVHWPGLPRVGEVLFSLGEFKASRHVLMSSLEKGNVNAEVMRTLAAVSHRLGAKQAARRHLSISAALRPITYDTRAAPTLPRVLRTRSLDGSFYAIRRRKGASYYTKWLKNGHFSLKHLLPRAKLGMHVANIFRGNLELLEDLPEVDLIMNLIACPDLMQDSLSRVAALIERYPEIPVVNSPDRVLHTTRARNAARLGQIEGVFFPRTEEIVVNDNSEDTLKRIEALDFGYPLILREMGTQTGDTLEKADDRGAALAYLSKVARRGALNVIEYVDCRAEDGFWHKTRCFFIDGVFHPVANLTNDDWQIHSGDRYRVMSTSLASQDVERAYLEEPRAYLGERAWAALHAISADIRLDFFGIDFTLGPDGGLIVFEANAAMRHNFDHAENFPYTRPHLERVTKSFEGMIRSRLALREAADRRAERDSAK